MGTGPDGMNTSSKVFSNQPNPLPHPALPSFHPLLFLLLGGVCMDVVGVWGVTPGKLLKSYIAVTELVTFIVCSIEIDGKITHPTLYVKNAQ